MKKDSSDTHTVISWKAPEFHYHKKDYRWFPVLAALTLILTAFFILTQQYIVAIIVVLGAMTIYQLAHQEPEVLPVIFSPQGIKVKGQFYAFNRLKNFWIIEAGEKHIRLHLQPIERFSSSLSIPMSTKDVEKIRDFLGHYLPEIHDAEEDLADRINRWLKI